MLPNSHQSAKYLGCVSWCLNWLHVYWICEHQLRGFLWKCPVNSTRPIACMRKSDQTVIEDVLALRMFVTYTVNLVYGQCTFDICLTRSICAWWICMRVAMDYRYIDRKLTSVLHFDITIIGFRGLGVTRISERTRIRVGDRCWTSASNLLSIRRGWHHTPRSRSSRRIA